MTVQDMHGWLQHLFNFSCKDNMSPTSSCSWSCSAWQSHPQCHAVPPLFIPHLDKVARGHDRGAHLHENRKASTECRRQHQNCFFKSSLSISWERITTSVTVTIIIPQLNNVRAECSTEGDFLDKLFTKGVSIWAAARLCGAVPCVDNVHCTMPLRYSLSFHCPKFLRA
jgi:hypothetical protein